MNTQKAGAGTDPISYTKMLILAIALPVHFFLLNKVLYGILFWGFFILTIGTTWFWNTDLGLGTDPWGQGIGFQTLMFIVLAALWFISLIKTKTWVEDKQNT